MPLREGVYQILRSSIVEGDLAPGEHLAEQQLAAELGVSRT
ncbi:MAG TPA: GntR family transcriptional regulator, partial [bacterium]|nr:GntR family transcriptional regulator [bacterium]